MAVVFSDLFTDTNGTALTSHTPTSGSWTNVSNGTLASIQSNALRGPDGYRAVECIAVGTATLADGFVESSMKEPSGGADTNFKLYFSYTDASNHYFLEWRTFSSFRDVKMYKRSGGTNTQLGSTYSTGALTVGVFYPIRLTKSGGALSVQFNGSTVISATDGTPFSTSSHTRFMWAANVPGHDLDYFTVDDGGSGSPTPTPAFGRYGVRGPVR